MQAPRKRREASIMRSQVSLATGLIVAFGSLAYPVCGTAQPIDIDSIREHLRQQWESIESIEWVLDEYLEREDGVALPVPGHLHYELSRSKGGLSYYKIENAAKGHERVLSHVLEDGKKRYNYVHLHDYPGVIHELDISTQQTIDEGLDDVPQNSITWLTTPGKKPLYLHMTNEARAQEIDEDGRKLIEVILPYKGSELRCVLDTERDWSVVSIEVLNGDRIKWSITKFQRDNGRWFASEGVHTGKIVGRYQEWTFKVTNPKINRPVAPGTYDQARLPSGALVVDRVKNTRRVWNGTNKTRTEFLARYPSKSPKPAALAAANSIEASQEPEEGIWSYAPMALACMFLGLAGILKLGRRRA